MRKPFQGVWNIVRFNWQYYILAIVTSLVLLLLRNRFNADVRWVTNILAGFIISSILISLVVSFYIYDFSNLYKLSWLDKFPVTGKAKIVNINAGFDETSYLLKSKYSHSDLLVFDFYDPVNHTALSIKRARKLYPPYPNTQHVKTNQLPLLDNSIEKVFAILSAHEIRNDDERSLFFMELKRVLTPTGHIILTEHLRDAANFFTYNLGAFHFHSKVSWLRTFNSAGLRVVEEIKITPFITTFIIDKNGMAS